MYHQYFKRPFDFIVSLLVLMLTLPLTLATWLLLTVQNRGTAFFVQQRPGKDRRPFNIVKFKTMNDRRNAQGVLLPDNARLTTLGKVVRKLSIDELPQLLNVLKGEMSLIGPRPLLFKYLPLYSAEQDRRHHVRPGITGWAQINGRNAISWTRKFELDVYYVDNISFVLDCKIFWLTLVKILKREGINQSEARPMQPFNGLN